MKENKSKTHVTDSFVLKEQAWNPLVSLIWWHTIAGYCGWKVLKCLISEIMNADCWKTIGGASQMNSWEMWGNGIFFVELLQKASSAICQKCKTEIEFRIIVMAENLVLTDATKLDIEFVQSLFVGNSIFFGYWQAHTIQNNMKDLTWRDGRMILNYFITWMTVWAQVFARNFGSWVSPPWEWHLVLKATPTLALKKKKGGPVLQQIFSPLTPKWNIGNAN